MEEQKDKQNVPKTNPNVSDPSGSKFS